MAKLHLLLKAFTLLFSLLASNVLSQTGIATFYTDQSRVACPGHGDRVTIAAVSSKLWDNGHVCGKRMTVECIGAVGERGPNPCKGHGRLTLTIRDFCDNCRGLIDLTLKEFESIADEGAGEVLVHYHMLD